MSDLTEFRDALKKSRETVIPFVVKAMGLAITAVEEIISPYPPQPPRDRAKTFNTYVRGVGRYPKSAFTGGKIKTKGAKIKRASQRMNTKFRTETNVQNDEVVGELRNEADYSGWVLGSEDKTKDPHQTEYHAQTGWVNEDEALRQADSEISRIFDEMADDFLKSL